MNLRAGVACALLAATAGLAPPACAQPQLGRIADPTRPPSVVPAEVSGGERSAPATRLQSVLISPGRRLAVINGRTYAAGDRIGDARVVTITETQVVLRSGRQLEVLKLFAGTEKTRVRRAQGAAGMEKAK